MVARLILALLLALGALPAAAMPATCHADPAMVGMVMDAPDGATNGRDADQHRHPAPVAEHGCIGCAALADPDGGRIAAPAIAPAVPLVARLARLVLGAAGPPTLRPPRIG